MQKSNPLEFVEAITRNTINRLYPEIGLEKLNNLENVNDLISSLQKKKETVEAAWFSLNAKARPQLVCHPSIIGTVCSAAEIVSEGGGIMKDQAMLRVISWHLQAYIDINLVIGRIDGLRMSLKYPSLRFQVLELLKELQPGKWDEQVDTRLEPFGNPVYVRSLLKFPNLTLDQATQAQKCYYEFLGNSVLVDDVESATQFIKIVNDDTTYDINCSVVLTRDGHRLVNEFILGAQAEIAPSYDQLNHTMWMAEPTVIQSLDEQLKKLEDLKRLMIERNQS